MAKAKAKKKVAEEVAPAVEKPEPAQEPEATEPLSPERVHGLLGLSAPYEPPPRPPGRDGFVTFWDPGVSIRSLVKSHRPLFYLNKFEQRFAGVTDSWRWKQIRLCAAETGRPFDEQKKELKLGELPTAREVVVFLVLHFLATGERLQIPRLRCRDVEPSGRRALVGPFHELGFDIGNVGDDWESPGIGIAEIYVPRRK